MLARSDAPRVAAVRALREAPLLTADCPPLEGAVERAAGGCLVATLLTVLVVALAVVLGPSSLLVVAGIGLAAVGWAVQR